MPDYVVTGPDGKDYEVTAPEGSTDAQIIQQVQGYITSNSTPVEEEEDESPGFLRRTGDVATSVVTGIPKALGALTSLASSVPYLNVVADPIAQGLFDIGEYGDDALLSDYQQQQNDELSARIQEAASQLDQISEDASLAEKATFVYDTMIAQGGEAAEYISENPSQVFNLIGQTLPHIFLGGAVGKGLKTAGLVKNAGVAGAIGEGVIAGGDSVGGIVRDQRAEGDFEYDPSRLYGLAAGATTGLISRGGAKFNPVDIDSIAAGGAKDLLGTGSGGVIKNTAKGLVVEGAEEFLQSGQEQAFTNLGTGDPVYEGVGSSAVLGAVTGAPLGAGVNIYSSMQESQVSKEMGEQVLADQQDLIKLREQQREEEKAAGLQEQQRIVEQGRLRREAASSFTPKKEFTGALQAQITAQQEQDVLNPETDLGREFEAQLNEAEIFDDEGIQAAKVKYLKGYNKENNPAEQVEGEYLAALDAHVGNFGKAKEVVAQNPAVMDMDDEAFSATAQQDPEVYRVVDTLRQAARNTANDETLGVEAETTAPEAPVEKPKRVTKAQDFRIRAKEALGETWEVDFPELSAVAENRNSLTVKNKSGVSKADRLLAEAVAERDAAQAPQIEAPAVDESPVVETETAPVEAQEAVEAPPVLEGMEAMAVSYTEEKLGPNWRKEQPQLVPLLEAGEYPGLQANVDRIAAEQTAATEVVEPEVEEPSTEVAEAEAATAVDNLFAQPLPPEVKLSKNEQAVFDTLNKAFQNNEQDQVIQANGSLNATRIAEMAGLNSKQAAQTAITRLRPKIARAYNLDQKQIKQRLADTRVKNVEAFDQNAPDQVFDQAELGNSSGTIASANQGAETDMRIEDIQFKDAIPEAPNRVVTAEQKAAIQQEIDTEIRADRGYKTAQETWDNGFESDVENEADRISFETLDAGTRFEWLDSSTEYNRGNMNLDDLGVIYDQLRAMYIKDNQDAKLETTDEVGQIESGTDTQASGQDDSQVRGEGGQAGNNQVEEDNQLTSAQFKARAANVEIKSKKKRKLVKPTVEAQDAKRQGQDVELKAVDAVANKLGGEVVYQKGDIALVRGYSSVSGAPVYSAAKGSLFTNLDVESYKGDQFTAEQLTELKKAKQDAEAEAQRVHEETPFVTYSDGLAFSGNVTPEVQGIVNEWKGLLGLGADVYVTTLEDAKADKLKFTGPLRAVGSGTLNPNERGSTRRLSDGSHYIIFDEQASKVGTLETIAHEMGHVHQKTVFDQATPAVKKALVDEHGKWLRSQTGSTAKGLVKSLRARKTGKTTDIASDLPFNQIAPYWKSFSEWYADQTSRWATTQDRPVSVVERFFARLGSAMKSFYNKLANKDYLPSDAFVQYLDQVKDVALTDPMNDAEGSESSAMESSLEPSPEEKSKTIKALGRVMSEGAAVQLTANVKQVARSPLSTLKFMGRTVRDNKEAMPSAAKFLDTLYLQEQTIQEELLKVEKIVAPTRELTSEQLAAMNDFVAKSTLYQKWGYDIEIDGKKIKADPLMKRSFDKLAPAAQSVAKDIFSYNIETRAKMKEEAEARGVKDVFKSSKLDGPYAKLSRFGGYVTVLRSAPLMRLQAEVQANPKNTKMAKRLDEMMTKPEDYVVKFFDTMGEAERYAAEEGPKYKSAVASEKEVGELENRVTNPEAFASVMAAVGADDKSGLDDVTKGSVRKIVEKLFYETLDEQSARLSGIKRLNRAGFDKDMVRSFVSHAQSQSRLLAQVRHGAEVNQALRDMKQEARKNRAELQQIANVLSLKYQNLLTKDDRMFAAAQDTITSFNSMTMLTTNVAYHVANATQTAISQAKLAGDFNSYSGAGGAIAKGYKSAFKIVDSSLLKQLGTVTTVGMIDMGNTVALDIEKAAPEHRGVLKKMQGRQMLDMGIEQDLNMEVMFNTGYNALNTASKAFRDMSHRLYQSSRYVEAHNRVAVAIAAYDMAVKNPAVMRRKKMTPEEYAMSIVEDTQGNYSNIDAPLIIDSVGKVTSQFRKFQLVMGWLWGSTFRDAMIGKSKEEKAAARRTLAYLGANVAALAGVRGVPFVGFIGTVALMAFSRGEEDQDDPKDVDRWIKENFENDLAAEVLTRGLPALLGIDLSAKVQQRDIFMPLNIEYIDTSPDAKPGMNVAYNLLLGPTAGTIGNFDQALKQYARGDISRAVEYLLPKGQRSALESLRIAQEGYSFSNGDVILNPTQIGMGELFRNALGLTPMQLSNVKWTYGQQLEITKHFTDEQSRMKRDYVRAKKADDGKAMDALRGEWRDLQRQKDRMREFFNDDPNSIPRTDMGELMLSDMKKRNRERKKQRQLGVGE